MRRVSYTTFEGKTYYDIIRAIEYTQYGFTKSSIKTRFQ